jgi:hypothetical protein
MANNIKKEMKKLGFTDEEFQEIVDILTNNVILVDRMRKLHSWAEDRKEILSSKGIDTRGFSMTVTDMANPDYPVKVERE